MAGVLRVTTERWHHQHIIGTLKLASQTVPTADSDPLLIQRWVDNLSQQLAWDLAVADPNGQLIAASGRLINQPLPDFNDKPIQRVRGLGPVVQRTLADGRTLTGRLPPPRRSRWYSWLLILVVAVTLGAHPLSRRITRRLERLQVGVETVGTGAPGAKVAVEGDDEIAQLARSFNDTFATLQQLLSQRTLMLATASHELRTPLARLRVALELLATDPREDLQQQIQRDITELDELVGELLLASRMEVGNGAERYEKLDLLALTAEEAAQSGLEVGGETVDMRGDKQALTVLVRNLISNAKRHGGSIIEVNVTAIDAQSARLTVSDSGPGIPEAQRKEIFEPFYRVEGSHRPDDDSGEKGIGLGLYLVRQIARFHGGEAICRESVTGGCYFEITVRRIAEES